MLKVKFKKKCYAGDPNKVLLFDKLSNKRLSFYYLNVFRFFKSIFINLDFDTSTSQIRCKLLEIYRLKDRVSFSREADFGDFGVINFYKSQMQGIFIYVITS